MPPTQTANSPTRQPGLWHECNLGTQTPFRWLEADHIQPSSKGGFTDLRNGQMINGAENKAKRDTWNPRPE